MAMKTVSLNARIEPDLKANAEKILSKLGLSASSAISMFYNQIVIHGGIPFSVTLPEDTRVSVHELSESRMNEELDKGYQEFLCGNARPADEVFDEMYKNNPRIRAALDRGIDDLEAGRVVSRDDANDIIEKRMEELINAREAV